MQDCRLKQLLATQLRWGCVEAGVQVLHLVVSTCPDASQAHPGACNVHAMAAGIEQLW